MNLSMLTILMLFLLSSIIMMITITISKKSITDQEKLSPFECGFNPAISPRIPFSLRFFLIAMIFLIFDVEIVLLLPLPISTLNPNMVFITAFLFILVLSMGLYHEWNKGILNWNK
uniref:NADH-ubiquinone oxidoreductase chain 3 n=1 Tax=Eremobates cf. palpisetulosus SEM-2008 TaxID=507470 RepID=B2CKF2_9ARAC|nr:NADH dehydrogenase subunit 3 [Eremobates cf. palpisetulosus SEM-2008]ACA49840.1 NADH dehydrogenase subunit 3 [Eremobates cf. palpisetulosus SEM-2008]